MKWDLAAYLELVRRESPDDPVDGIMYTQAAVALADEVERLRDELGYCQQCTAQIEHRCDAYRDDYGFKCVLPACHPGPHFDMNGGHWTHESGQVVEWHELTEVMVPVNCEHCGGNLATDHWRVCGLGRGAFGRTARSLDD